MRMTLLEWSRNGRSGVFKTPHWTVETGKAGNLIFFGLSEGRKAWMIPFASLKQMAGYLGQGPTEIEGEVE